MSKTGWEGIDVLNEKSREGVLDQLELDKSFARTFETEEGKKVLKYLISRTLHQPTWIPGGDTSFGFAREGQNSIIREIQTRIERAKA